MTANERRPEWRVRYARKLFAMLCCCVLVLGVIEPPKAHAIAAVDDAYMLVAAYLDACGLSWGLTAVDDKEEFAQAVADLVTSYTGTIGTTVTDWMTTITQASVVGGKLYLSKAQIGQLSAFVSWLIGDKGITAGGNSVLLSSQVTLGGVTFVPTLGWTRNSYGWIKPTSLGTVFPVGSVLNFGIKALTITSVSAGVSVTTSDGLGPSTYSNSTSYGPITGVTFFLADGFLGVGYVATKTGYMRVESAYQHAIPAISVTTSITSDVSLIPAKAIDVPDASTMKDDETLAIDVGAGATAGSLADVLAKIWESIQAGTKAATKEVVKGDTETGEVTDVSDLGLPALGIALKSRFPFSIPWDFVSAVKLLARPAQTPYWHVDLLQPIQAKYGILNGDTSITIDLGQYPFIGEVSRWISTFFFGVGLMMATKKLIWTT